MAVVIGIYYHLSYRPARPMEVEYVISPSLDMLDTPAVVHKVVAMLKYGDRVDVLKVQGSWAKARAGAGIEGWVITKELIPAKVYESGQKVLEELRRKQPQAAGHTVQAANIHLEPQRESPTLGMLMQGQTLEVFDRRVVPRNPDGSGAKPAGPAARESDAWYLVEAGSRAGWILGRMATLDIPPAISQYAADYNVVAWFVVDKVQDGSASVPQYLAADRTGTVEFDFTRVRVFTWSVKYHHYVTAFVKGGLKGNFPIRVEHINNIPYFRLRLVDDKGNKFQSVYGMFHTIVRPVGTVEGWESNAMPQPKGR
ncbi:MAG TPA: SH3 domain-containing protein [Terriglobia bacterium]|nr:SH3 domain-containing protein [Terriglobia bacterium]